MTTYRLLEIVDFSNLWSNTYFPIQVKTCSDHEKISEDVFIVMKHFYVVALRGLCLSFVIIKEAEPI